jgi:hypothetical protein
MSSAIAQIPKMEASHYEIEVFMFLWRLREALSRTRKARKIVPMMILVHGDSFHLTHFSA